MKKFMIVIVISVLVLSVVPAMADGKSSNGKELVAFQALGTMPTVEHTALKAMTDEELASIEGQYRWEHPRRYQGFSINNAVIIQVNVCGLCDNVLQTNAATAWLGN